MAHFKGEWRLPSRRSTGIGLGSALALLGVCIGIIAVRGGEAGPGDAQAEDSASVAAFEAAKRAGPSAPSLASVRKRAQKLGPNPVLQTNVDGFSFHLPGDLKQGTGEGALDDLIHAPKMRFPLEEGPAYVNSQVWGYGGIAGNGGGECHPKNYGYPWRDNFCETRAWISGACPGGVGHQGVDIRPRTCRNNEHWAVAAEDGRISSIGGYAVTLAADSGLQYRYLHVNTKRLKIQRGQRVAAGDRIALVSNFFGGTPTTVHLHFEMRRPRPGGGYDLLNPYASLIPAYLRLIARDEAEAAAAMAAIGGPGDFAAFRDCDVCPQMVAVPGGAATLGSETSETGRGVDEGPTRRLTLPRFAIGRTEVTIGDWRACVDDGFCRPAKDGETWADGGGSDAALPITGVSRADITGQGGATSGFIAWVNAKAAAAGVDGAPYRLPSEAEWEHAARAGAAGPFATGGSVTPDKANFDARFATSFPAELRARRGPVAAGTLPPNAFNVHELAGNVWEWTADCWAPDHADAPRDGAPKQTGDCRSGVVKGGSLFSFAEDLRPANRRALPAAATAQDIGFRLARRFD